MTQIEFFTDVGRPLRATAGLVAKAYARGRRVRVVTPDATTTEALDALLWELPPDGFLPHVALSSPLANATPIIVDHEPTHAGAADVLVNLCLAPPAFFARFERLIEIVGAEPELAAAGRDRWAFYKARGYEMVHTSMKRA